MMTGMAERIRWMYFHITRPNGDLLLPRLEAETTKPLEKLVAHLADSELVFAYRALRFARGDGTPLPGFEQDDWVPHAGCDRCSLAEMVDLLGRARALSLALFGTFPDEAWGRHGVANDDGIVVSAFPWIIAGHELHHRRLVVKADGGDGFGGVLLLVLVGERRDQLVDVGRRAEHLLDERGDGLVVGGLPEELLPRGGLDR